MRKSLLEVIQLASREVFILWILNIATLFIKELCFESAPALIIEEDRGWMERGNDSPAHHLLAVQHARYICVHSHLIHQMFHQGPTLCQALHWGWNGRPVCVTSSSCPCGVTSMHISSMSAAWCFRMEMQNGVQGRLTVEGPPLSRKGKQEMLSGGPRTSVETWPLRRRQTRWAERAESFRLDSLEYGKEIQGSYFGLLDPLHRLPPVLNIS